MGDSQVQDYKQSLKHKRKKPIVGSGKLGRGVRDSDFALFFQDDDDDDYDVEYYEEEDG